MTELIPEYIINKDGGKVSPITSANTVFRENGNRIEDEIDEAIQKSKNAITADNLIQGHGISITKDDNNITISNKAAEHIQLLFLDTDENNPILTNIQPSVNKIILPITPFSAPTGEWIEFLTVNAFDDIKDMEVQFIPNNRFSAKLWLNSSRSRDNIQVRMQVFDTSDNTILASATAKINLLGDETIPIPILFENIHQELRELPLSQIQIVMSIMPSQSGVQIGVVSKPSDEISYINITTAAGITESGKDGFSPEIIEAVNTETTYQLDIKTADDEFRTPNLKGGVIAGQSIGVIGTFAKQSMSSKWTYIKFIPTEGQVETIDVDGSWICPKDGIYMISCHLGVSNSVSSSIRYFALQLNATTVMTDSAMIAYVSSSASTALPTINRTIKLAKGDNISAWFNCSAAMTINNTDDSRVSKFSITLDSSIDLTIWDAYETWKSLDSSREESTFDDWISTQLKQSTVRCSGEMVDRPISGNYSFTLMTPKINNGDTSLVSNNKFIAPIDGLYCLSVSTNRTSATGYLFVTIQLNADLYDATKEISRADSPNNNAFPSISCIKYLNKGDFLVYTCASSVAQSLSSIANTSLKFEFALLGSSETINIKDMVSPKEDNTLEILDGKLYLPKTETPTVTITDDESYAVGEGLGFAGSKEEWLDALSSLKLLLGNNAVSSLTYTIDEILSQKAAYQWNNAEINVEYWTGKRWINGKKIYGKIIDLGAYPNNTGKLVPHNILNLERLIKAEGVAHNPSGTDIPIVHTSIPAPNLVTGNTWHLSQDRQTFSIITTADRRAWSGIMIVEYICTDR